MYEEWGIVCHPEAEPVHPAGDKDKGKPQIVDLEED
jgi:hypothetical protein